MLRWSVIACLMLVGCEDQASNRVQQASVTVKTGDDGLTVEQRNISKRLLADNAPKSVKHLYVISATSGQVILYSTVDGKVTSSGKRLTPTSIAEGHGTTIGNYTYITTEVLQDDGTYGASVPYIYWFDIKGAYHQHFISGGQIVHVTDQPLPIKNALISVAPEQ